MSLLVVSAVRFEAEPSLQILRDKGLAFTFFELGIGPLNAARSAVRLGELCRNRTVLFLGSCGSFYPFHAPHLLTVDTVWWLTPCVRAGIAGFPEHVHPPFSLPQTRLALPVKTVLTAASISLSSDFAPAVRAKLPDPEHLVENMELYACIEALLEAKTLDLILGVTNAVGSQSRAQWASHHRRVAQLTAEFLEESYDLESVRSELPA